MAKRKKTKFSTKLDLILEELAKKENMTKDELVKKAVSLYNYLYKETIKKDQKHGISDSTGEDIKEIVL